MFESECPAIEIAYPILFARLKARFRDEQLADEVSRDCLSQAYEQLLRDPTYFIDHDLLNWTSTRANWRAIDQLRRRNRFASLPEDRPLAEVSEEENRIAAWEALNQLDDMDRQILIGHYYDGRSDQDLGTELFGESGTLTARGLRVWRLRQKAQARLRDLLMESGFEMEDHAGQAV